MSGLCDWRSDAFTFQENEAFCNEVTELALAERPLRMFFQAGQLLCELALAEWLLVASRIAVGSSSILRSGYRIKRRLREIDQVRK